MQLNTVRTFFQQSTLVALGFATDDSPHGSFTTQRVRHTNVTENLSVNVGQTCATVPMRKIRHIEDSPHNKKRANMTENSSVNVRQTFVTEPTRKIRLLKGSSAKRIYLLFLLS